MQAQKRRSKDEKSAVQDDDDGKVSVGDLDDNEVLDNQGELLQGADRFSSNLRSLFTSDQGVATRPQTRVLL